MAGASIGPGRLLTRQCERLGKADGPEAAAELKKLLGDVIAGKAKAAARSEAKPSKMHGPGSGRVDKVVSKTAVEFVNQSSGEDTGCPSVPTRHA